MAHPNRIDTNSLVTGMRWGFAIFFFLFFAIISLPSAAHAASITWGGGGATNNWTDCANWVGGVCPNSGDSVVFNTTSVKDSIINSTATSSITNVTISSGYTGGITQQLSTMTITGTYSQAAGTFTQGANTLVLSGTGGSFTLSSGIYNVGIATTSFAGNVTISGGTYNASSTSVANFNNSINAGTSSLTCGITFPGVVNIAMLGSGAQTFTVGSGCTITTASTTITNATVVANGTINFESVVDTGGLSIGSSGTVTTATTTFTFSDGTNASNFTQSSGATFNSSGITLNFTSAGNATQSTFTCTGTFAGVVNIAITGGGVPTFTVASGCAITTTATTNTTAAVTANGTINFGSAVTVGSLSVGSSGTLTTTATTINLNATTNASNFTQSSGATFNSSGITLNFNSSGNASPSTFTCTGTFAGVVNLAQSGSGVPTFTVASGCAITTAATTNTTSSVTANGTINFGSSVTIGDLSIGSSGTVTSAATTINLNATTNASNFSEVSGSTFNASGITLNFNSSGNAPPSTFSCVGTFPGVVNMAQSGGGVPTFTLASGCSITAAGTTNTTASITINGTLDLTGNSLATTHSFTIGSTGTLRLQGGETSITAPTLNASSTVEYYGSGSYNSLKAGSTYQNISFTGSGSWATSTDLTVNGGFKQTSGTFTHTGILTFAGSTGSSFATTSSGTTLKSVTVNKSGQILTLAGSGLSLSGNLTLTAGTLDASTAGCSSASCNITLAGNWVGGNNLFTARTSTVTFNGTNQQVTGTSTFYAFTKITSSTDTLTFGANQTQTIANTWTTQGASGNVLSLRSSSTGTQWKIDPQSTRTISYLDVEDSDNIDASTITATGLHIANSNDNTNWSFDTAPTITTSAASLVATSTATLNGSITATGGVDATQSGFAYSTVSNLATTIATSTLGAQSGTASFLQNITSLTPNTTYYARAYATNSIGTSFGSIVSFTTFNTPTVTLQAASSITQTAATLNGNVTATGGATVTTEGFNYGLTTSYGLTASSTGSFSTGAFTQSITGLACNTTYDMEAVASNSMGTSTSANSTFTTNACAPSVTTSAASSVAASSATLNGSITATGGVDATQSGFAYSTVSNLATTIATSTLGSQTGTASFTQNLTSLTTSTTYYFRAYATNSGGTSFGSILSFTTLGVPSVTPVSITSNDASTTLAKIGTVVTVSFTSNQSSLIAPTGTIGIHAATILSGGGNSWIASTTMTSSDIEGVIGFSFTVGNTDGSATTTITSVTTGASVTFDKTAPTITLLGSNPATVSGSGSYTDPGATALDGHDGTLTSSIIISGTVDTTPGTYTKTYSVSDAAGNATSTTRTVTVTAASTPSPSTTLSGGNGQVVNSGPSAPSSVSLQLPKPRLQIIYADGHVVYLDATSTSAPSATSAPTILTRNRQLYETGSDILVLQKFLNTHGFVIAKTDAGSPDKETTYFGIKTFQALKKYQTAKGLPSSGYLGPLTRKAIAGE